MSASEHHPQSPRSRRRPVRGPLRILAAALCLTLAFASVAPTFALAREADSEGEGSAAPGTIPGLEGGELGAGGEEIALGEVAIGAGEEAEEEVPPPEAEPAPVPEPPATEPAPEATPVEPPPAPETPVAEPAPAPAATPAPVYEEESGPTYETAPSPPGVVENEPLAAPAAPVPGGPHREEEGASAEPAPVPVAPAPEPVEAPEAQVAPPPSATPVETGQAPGSLRGRPSHIVRAGECLWSIAEAVLPSGASDATIAAEVRRLWRLNASRIGTGDPSLILVGTVLRLH